MNEKTEVECKSENLTWPEVIVLIALFFSICFYLAPNKTFNILDLLVKIAGIFAVGSIFYAARTYNDSKRQDHLRYTTDQISLFRKEIVSEAYKINNKMLSLKIEPTTIGISMENQDLGFMRTNFPIQFKNQEILISNTEISELKTNLLNTMEEFALRVLNSETASSKILNSVKPMFVMLVESNALLLISHRNISTGNEIYSGILDLYLKWVGGIDRTSPSERRQKFLQSTTPSPSPTPTPAVAPE